MKLTQTEQQILNTYRALDDVNKQRFNAVVKFIGTATEKEKSELQEATGIDLNAGLKSNQIPILEQYAVAKAGSSLKNTYSIKEAAALIGVTYRTCIEYIRTDKLPAHKIGGTWAIDTADLQKFIGQ